MDQTSAEEQQRAIAECFKKHKKEKVGEEWCIIPLLWWNKFCSYCGLNPKNPEKWSERGGPKPGKLDYSKMVKQGKYLFKDEIADNIQERKDFIWAHSSVHNYFKNWGYTDNTGELRNGIRRSVQTRGGRENFIEFKPWSCRYTIMSSKGGMLKPTSIRISGQSCLDDLLRQVYQDDINEEEEKKNNCNENEQKKKVPGRMWFLTESWKLIPEEVMTEKVENVANTLDVKKGDAWLTFMLEFKNHDGTWPCDWKGFISVGDILDAQDFKTDWYESKVLLVEKDRIKVRFINWPSKWDEFISKKSKRLLPRGDKTAGPYDPNRKPKDESEDYSSYSSYPSTRLMRQNSVGPPSVCGAVGLRNLGNTCFMNSTLQCLSNTPRLTQYFREDRYNKDINRNNPLGQKGQLAIAYADLIKAMWGSQYKTVAPVEFKKMIAQVQPRFSGYQQHDSSELLQFLLDGLHEDLNRVLDKPFTQAVEDQGRPDAEVAKEAWSRHLQRNKSIIVDLCQGQLKSVVRCPDCNRKSVTFDPFMFVSVPIPSRKKNVKLSDCLKEFSKGEVLDEQNAWYCRNCKKHQCATKKIDLWSLPATLIIHFKRFHFDQNSREKIETMIDFPIHNLNMKNWIVNKKTDEKDCIYNLFAVSNHMGNLGGGHYTAYAKNLTDNKWYHLNDESVSPLSSASNAKTQSAYVLFYQRQGFKKRTGAKTTTT